MGWAILAFAAIGAVATVYGLYADRQRNRQRLELEFQHAYTNEPKYVVFTLRVTNAGPAPISRVDLLRFTAVPGWTFTGREALDPFPLGPFEHRDVPVPFWKPTVDLPPNTVKPQFAHPVGVIAFYGGQSVMAMHPDGPTADPKLLRGIRRFVRRPVASSPTRTG